MAPAIKVSDERAQQVDALSCVRDTHTLYVYIYTVHMHIYMYTYTHGRARARPVI